MANHIWPPITVQVITYKRPALIRKILDHLIENLRYPNLRWLVSDDCSGEDYGRALVEEYAHVSLRYVSTRQQSGWGANANLGMSVIDSPYIYLNEDDYLLWSPIDLCPAIALMERNPRIGLMRYDGLVGHRLHLALQQTNIADWMPEYRQAWGEPGVVYYCRLMHESPELWCYSHRPHLKHKRFHSRYGPYPVGLPLGKTEEIYAHIVKDIMDNDDKSPQIAAMPDAINRYYDHIGVSYQFTDEDITPKLEGG